MAEPTPAAELRPFTEADWDRLREQMVRDGALPADFIETDDEYLPLNLWDSTP